MKTLRSVQTMLFDSRPMLLTNPFLNTSQLKPRIQMLINPGTNRRALWRYALLLPVAALLLMCSQKDPVQDKLPIAVNSPAGQHGPPAIGPILTMVEENPMPLGGMATLGNFLSQNLRYPEAAQKALVEGKVFVRFMVTDKGHITDVQVLKGIGFGCDEESVRVVQQMPDWIPGRQNGKPVNVQFNLPIAFTLQ